MIWETIHHWGIAPILSILEQREFFSGIKVFSSQKSISYEPSATKTGTSTSDLSGHKNYIWESMN